MSLENLRLIMLCLKWYFLQNKGSPLFRGVQSFNFEVDFMDKNTIKPTGFFRRLYRGLSSPTQRFQYGLWLIRNFPGESDVLLRYRYIAKYLKKTGEGFRAKSGVKIMIWSINYKYNDKIPIYTSKGGTKSLLWFPMAAGSKLEFSFYLAQYWARAAWSEPALFWKGKTIQPGHS